MKEIKPEDIKEMSESELHKTLYEYFKPVLEDCSQGARLKYIREYRQLSTKEVAELCPHLTGENKIRSIQKYESNTRSPKPYILESTKYIIASSSVSSFIIHLALSIFNISNALFLL